MFKVTSMLELVEEIKDEVSENVVDVKKHEFGGEIWYHIILDVKNELEEGEHLIVLVAEEETVLGWSWTNIERDEILHIDHYHHDYLTDDEKNEIANDIVKEIRKYI